MRMRDSANLFAQSRNNHITIQLILFMTIFMCINYLFSCRVPFFFFVHSMLLNGIFTYLMTYLVLKGGGGGFFVWIGIVVLIFFSVPVVIMLGYTVSLTFSCCMACFYNSENYFSTEGKFYIRCT